MDIENVLTFSELLHAVELYNGYLFTNLFAVRPSSYNFPHQISSIHNPKEYNILVKLKAISSALVTKPELFYDMLCRQIKCGCICKCCF